MSHRKGVPLQTMTNILLKCRRRCCLCFFLHGDADVKEGQIAHIDRNPSNNEERNLVFLCLSHHNEYDSRPSQSKGMTDMELRHYRDTLHNEIEAAITDDSMRGGEEVVIEGKRIPIRIERPKLYITREEGVQVYTRTVHAKDAKNSITI